MIDLGDRLVKDTMLPQELAELWIYVQDGKNLFTKHVFRSYVMAVRVRRVVQELSAPRTQNSGA